MPRGRAHTTKTRPSVLKLSGEGGAYCHSRALARVPHLACFSCASSSIAFARCFGITPADARAPSAPEIPSTAQLRTEVLLPNKTLPRTCHGTSRGGSSTRGIGARYGPPTAEVHESIISSLAANRAPPCDREIPRSFGKQTTTARCRLQMRQPRVYRAFVASASSMHSAPWTHHDGKSQPSRRARTSGGGPAHCDPSQPYSSTSRARALVAPSRRARRRRR
jgi:hypothetical protein